MSGSAGDSGETGGSDSDVSYGSGFDVMEDLGFDELLFNSEPVVTGEVRGPSNCTVEHDGLSIGYSKDMTRVDDDVKDNESSVSDGVGQWQWEDMDDLPRVPKNNWQPSLSPEQWAAKSFNMLPRPLQV